MSAPHPGPVGVGVEPWLVALDVDGTILHEDDTLDEEVTRAVREAHGRGHEVMLATGRSWVSTEPVMTRLGISPEYAVCSNGAVLMRRGEILGPDEPPVYEQAHVETFLPRDVLLRIREALPGGRYMVELPDATRCYTEGMIDWNLSDGREVAFEELLDTEVTRVVVVSPDHELEEFFRLVDGIGLHQVSYSIGWTAWLDIAPDGVNKATALERVRRRLRAPRSHLLAVGDGRNDIEMFAWARMLGRAVAMGQAPEEVRAAAREVTGTIHENGLVAVLDSLP